MIKFWSICQNTFVQTIRQPIYGILLLITLLVLVLSLPLSGRTLSLDYHASDQMMLESLGLSTLLIANLFIAAFSASGALTREIEERTALTVLTKPVSRPVFVLGKFAGVFGAVTVAFYLGSLAFLMVVRHRVMSAGADVYDIPVLTLGLSAFVLTLLIALLGNYFFNWSFISAGVWSSLILFTVAMAVLSVVGKGWQIVPPGYDTPTRQMIHGQLLLGIALTYMAVVVFSAVAVAASTRLSQVMTLMVCFAVLAVGSAHPAVFARWSDQAPIVRLLGWIPPNLTFFYAIDALQNEKVTIPLSYVGKALAYCVLYSAAILAVGVALFQNRQLEARTGSSSMPGAVALLSWGGRSLAILLGIAALVWVSIPAHYRVIDFVLGAAALILSGLLWLLWSGFGRGIRWTYWVTLLLGWIVLGVLVVAALWPAAMRLPEGDVERLFVLVGAAISAVVALILVLPKTRRHFYSKETLS